MLPMSKYRQNFSSFIPILFYFNYGILFVGTLLLQLSYCSPNNDLTFQLMGNRSIGGNLNLTCLKNDSKSIWWSNEASKNISKTDSQSLSLTFVNITLDDFGNYTCNAFLTSGQTLNKTFILASEVMPKIETRKVARIMRGENVSLNCTVTGYPISQDVQWEFKTNILTNSEDVTIVNERKSLAMSLSRLNIDNLSNHHNGTYICHCEGVKGETNLFVLGKPEVQIDVLTAVGQSQIFFNFTLHEGNSQIKNMTLFFKGPDNVKLEQKLDLKKTNFLIKKLANSTTYKDFRLEVVNKYGNVSAEIPYSITTLNEDPVFVPIVRVIGATSSTVNLDWFISPNISNYFHYYTVNVHSKEGHKNVTAYEVPYMVTGLNPGTIYFFQIQACSSYTGLCQAPSNIIEQNTMDGKSGPPRNITIECITEDKQESFIRTTWEEPSDPNGQIMEYIVILTGNASYLDQEGHEVEERHGPKTKTIATTQPRKAEFHGLPSNTKLQISVCAKTRSRMCGRHGTAFCSTPPNSPDREELSKATWKAVHRNSNETQIYFLIRLPYISQRNGSICCFRVIVVRLKKDETPSDLKLPSELKILTYEQVHNSSEGGAYIAEIIDSNSLRPQNIMIGDEEPHGGEKRVHCHRCSGYENNIQGFNGGFRRPQAFPQNDLEDGNTHKKRHASASMPGIVPEVRDGPLDAASTYTAFLEVVVTDGNSQAQITSQSRYFPPLPNRKTSPEEPVNTVAYAILGALIVALVVVLFALLCVMRWRRKEPNDGEYGIYHSINLWCRRLRGQHRIPTTNDPPNLPPISRDQLLSAFNERHKDSDYGFQQEFENLPDKFCDRTSHASDMRENQGKNRYPDIKAYDQTRVKLISINGDGSDYINANNVVGYKERKNFICAQGPMEATLSDWWRLIWEKHVHLILMLTNVEEYNKTKCAKYWPSEASMEHGEFTVTHTGEKRFSDYLTRSLKLSKNGGKDERNITQYHYLVWKDFVAPEHPVGIIRFIKRFNEVYTPEKGPILVHCSAGVGRTGTLVALDSLLQQLAEEDSVSIFNTICDLRHQRNYLVQSLKQYTFIYRALMEMAIFGDTDVPVSELKSFVEKSSKVAAGDEVSKLQEEFNRLTQPGLIEERKPMSAGSLEENRSRNRHDTIVPYDRHRVILSPMPRPNKEVCTYINASFIEGYENQEEFIITQDPLEGTVGDFWRMIMEQNVRSIVMLSEVGENKCPRYYPEKDQETSHDYIRVKYMQCESFPNYYRREFSLTNSKNCEDSFLVVQFQYNGWPVGEGEVPESTRGIIELVDTSLKYKESLEKNGTPIVVHCSAGTDRSCIFVALSILAQQIKNESRVDVFSLVRKLRSQRPGLFQTYAQFEFVYRVLVTYSELHFANGNASQ